MGTMLNCRGAQAAPRACLQSARVRGGCANKVSVGETEKKKKKISLSTEEAGDGSLSARSAESLLLSFPVPQ